MTKFSANLGFLWTELSLPDAIRAAAKAGFDAVEMHWPYETAASEVTVALAETGLPLLGINTVRGAAGENGLSALPGREAAARGAIDQAVRYAQDAGARAIHVMAGNAAGRSARQTFVSNLHFACDAAPDRTILIEPLNIHDAPGYFLTSAAQAAEIIAEVGRPNLKMMFDCYHMQIMGGDLTRRLAQYHEVIGHIQFASVPTRGTPDIGEVRFDHVFDFLKELGYKAPLGAEYRPQDGDTNASLGWMRQFSGSPSVRYARRR